MYIIGTSTLSEMILDFLDILDIEIEGFFDDYRKEKTFKKYRVIGGCQELIDNSEKYNESKFFVAIGSNSGREKVSKVIKEKGLSLCNIIHKNSFIERSTTIGNGNLIMSNAYIGSNCKIGDGNLIFPGVSITHHNIVDDYCFLSTNVSIGGYAHIQSFCKIGMNSVVKPYIQVKSGYNCGPLTLVDGEKMYG